ncbi:hypothetical protein MKW98_023309 [Papaver atlanticum]|uniref:Major facilitator superfamily (MFS) profile domain-containing protein n=1 Tax=Papaver atlanticum TaxID=357466 RepID=A0AAD4XVD6_9MAGN|nr:hypothetical protein MKW98_023309 [Papaver atlanticum]
MKSETLTLVLVNLAGIMERADESLLPGVYKEVGAALHTDPTGLGSLTLFRSIVEYWHMVAVSRGLNGIGLAMVTPAIQSLVADSTEDHNRGVAFGWLGLTGNIGSILGGLLSILWLPLHSWVFIIVGILVRLYAKDPMFVEKNCVNGDSSPGKSLSLELKEFLEEAKSVMKIPSFLILIAQGVSGSFPWSALAFAPMWLELIGFTHKETAFLWSMFQVACSIGGLFGGKMGDILSIRLPNLGRIILSQISAGSFIPLAWILIPIFAEIVPKKSRTSIYALDQSFESHVFGYTPAPQGSSQSVELETDRKNAASLAKALYTSIAIPITICALIYSFLYCTYPRDRDRAKMNAVIESEMEQLESDKLPIEGKYCQIQASEVYEKETAIELDCEVKDGLEVDDSDEKTLLTHEQVR